MNTTTVAVPESDVSTGAITRLRCRRCGAASESLAMSAACAACGGALAYEVDGTWPAPRPRDDQWRFFDLLPLRRPESILSLGEGGSEAIELPELSSAIGGAKLWLKLDGVKNPTGTFKDREASLIISRCRELGLNHLVFYSTGNTGRAYTHYAAQLGLTTYFFMPREAHYKQTASFRKERNNFVILVDGDYPQIGPYAKAFAAANGLTAIAPLHDRTESYATLAYEQHGQLPDCDWFVQTIASGMGPIGFLRGHRTLVKLGRETADRIPRIACVQSEETNSMYRAFTAGKTEMVPADVTAGGRLFEPTLNSTNPVANYPDLRECLIESRGTITDVSPRAAAAQQTRLATALAARRIHLQFDLEKSLLIGFAGLVRLAEEGQIRANERLLLLVTGRGGRVSRDLVPADATIRCGADDPKDVKARLDARC
jgi:threonine synthase